MAKQNDLKFTTCVEAGKPIRAKVKCPHCNKDIEIVIAGMAILPSDSEIVKFEMMWLEHG